MTALLRQAGLLLTALAASYGAILLLTLLLVPRPDEAAGLDSATAGQSLFMTEPKYIFLNRRQLRSEAPQVVLLGASNVVVGLRQPEVASLIKGAMVHNLAIGGANMTEVRQVFDLVQEMQSPAARRRTVFVIGMWYGNFFEDRQHWYTPDRHPGDTDIDIERLRYGFCRRSASGVVSVLPSRYLDLGVTAIHPYLVLDRLSRDATKSARQLLFKTVPERSEQQRNETVVSEADRRKALDFWRATIGRPADLGEEQFAVLRQTIDAMLESGARVLLVDLPIPRWHAERSPYSTSYRERTARLLATFSGRPGFTALTIPAMDADLDFYDEVHPKPQVTATWARHLAAALGPVVAHPADVLAATGARQQAQQAMP